MGTLSERVSEAINNGLTPSVPEVAKACDVSVQAVYQWMNGDTKQIMGEKLVELAEITGYSARWIATGKGDPKVTYARTDQEAHVLRAMQKMEGYQKDMVVKIADTVAESAPKKGNGNGDDSKVAA